MGIEENVAASVDDERDDLENTIRGIGRTFSDALNRIGIRRFEDLAQYTPDELSRVLHEQAGKKASSKKIETEDWIGQARVLAQQADIEHMSPEEEVEVAKDPEWPLNDPTWRQQAFFMLFFGHVTDEHGNQVWHTCVYHDESGDQKVIEDAEPIAREGFAGVATDPWVDWILERAKLLAVAEPLPMETEVAAPPAPVTPHDAKIGILGVQVSEIPTPLSVREKRLMAEVRFQISGPEAKTLATKRIPFRIEVHTVDLESGVSNLVASERGQLQPRGFEYMRQQEFPMPDPGRYELHSIVLLLPPGEMMASHRGPIIRVVP